MDRKKAARERARRLMEERGPGYFATLGRRGGLVRREKLGPDGMRRMAKKGGRARKAAGTDYAALANIRWERERKEKEGGDD